MSGNLIHIAFIMNDVSLNGITTVVFNYIEALAGKPYDISVIANRTMYVPLVEKMRQLGAQVYKLPEKKTSKLCEYRKALVDLLGKLSPDIVHINGSTSSVIVELEAAKKAGVEHRIVHCHNSNCGNPIQHKLLKPAVNSLCSARLACSASAGEWQFGTHKYTIIPNAFDTAHLRFDEQKRKDQRKKFRVSEDMFVIGNVARINSQKNQLFCIDVFEAYACNHDDAVMVFVGDGPLIEDLKARAEKSPYADRIIVYGQLDDVSIAYSAFDLFFFPSLHEGLGITVVEAQISGLPCIVSNAIPDEAIIVQSNIRRIGLDKPMEEWIKQLDELHQVKLNRKEQSDKTDASRFDIANCSGILETCYRKLVQDHGRE